MNAFQKAAEAVRNGADHHAQARVLLTQMTLPEKLGCLDGDTPFWPGLIDMSSGGYYTHTWPAAVVERLGIPGFHFADGPRGCVVGNATAFPVPMARGASFDPELEEQIGEAIGRELRASGATYTGAVCMNLLRHPAWGRAQETYGEDPHHVGDMAVAFMTGLQHHVLACMKHFALNSMENSRFRVDVTASERVLHEVYLPHFRRVAEAGVASVMSAYNSVNGEWCGQNRTLLIDILRDEWGWDGFVTSDFIFGLRDAARSVRNGLNVEMPFRQQRAQELGEAITSGDLLIEDVDTRVAETLATLLRFDPLLRRPAPDLSVIACSEHRMLARRSATGSMVLLKNEGHLLPLSAGGLKRVAVIGRLAAISNLGDGGSSDVHPPSVVTPLDGLRAYLLPTPDARDSAVEIVHSDFDASIALSVDVAIVVVGYTRDDEGEYIDNAGTGKLTSLFPPMDHPELGLDATSPRRPRREGQEPVMMALGGDRASLRLREADEELIAAVCAANANTIVAVMCGSAVVMPWLALPRSVLMLWYPGMEGGHALADVLFGEVDPGGRLPFVVPANEEDLVPFSRDADRATYDLFHGQWQLERDNKPVVFPFGFGLSYASFRFGEPTVNSPVNPLTGERFDVEVPVSNIGSRAGSCVVQIYAGRSDSAWDRPASRLIGFRKVHLEAGATAVVSIAASTRPLLIRGEDGWLMEPGTYALRIGQHASDPAAVGAVVSIG